jgi:hypothetical protein
MAASTRGSAEAATRTDDSSSGKAVVSPPESTWLFLGFGCNREDLG